MPSRGSISRILHTQDLEPTTQKTQPKGPKGSVAKERPDFVCIYEWYIMLNLQPKHTVGPAIALVNFVLLDDWSNLFPHVIEAFLYLLCDIIGGYTEREGYV